MKIGIVGGGQLAQLLAHSAYTLGLETLCYCQSDDVPAKRNSPLVIGELTDEKALAAFAEQVDVITWENENVTAQTIDVLAAVAPIHPGKTALLVAQDRLLEKQLFQQLSIPIAPYIAMSQQADSAQSDRIDYPAIMKTRRLGYDGKGQKGVVDADDLVDAWHALDKAEVVIEQKLAFDFEVSQIAARDMQGHMVFYPLLKNDHKDGILRQTQCPYVDDSLQQQAQHYIQRVMEQLDYVGVLTLEFFVLQGQLVVNEMAPRVHNSGHVTIEATRCSQFENHLRAVAGLPLVEPTVVAAAKMANIIGEWPKTLPGKPDRRLYDYKKTPRPGRKLGHVVWLVET